FLYVATANTPDRALADQSTDNAAAVGHVEVYDLNPVRSGKVEDGAELKPVATVSLGKMIRGVELCDDGKLLCVLTTTTSAPFKSQLHKYDTTELPKGPKSTVTKDLPQGAWDMCKSPDGKTLLITELPAAAKGASVRFYDPVNMTSVKSFQFNAT